MEYRAVGDRCAVDLDDLKLLIQNDDVMAILKGKGFDALHVDLVRLARECIRTSLYRRGARFSEAPSIVDCSSFMKWLYAQRGVWLPRRSIQQREYGAVVALDEVVAGDVVFVSGWIDYFDDDPADGVGHVGIATGEGTVIHAANSSLGVVESPLERFIGNGKFRGARRYVPQGREVLTLKTPIGRDIETANDIKWIVLQSLPGKGTR